MAADLADYVASLPDGFSAWASADGTDDEVVPFAEAPRDADLQSVLIRDDASDVRVLQINAEDGAPRAWVYKRDARLQLPWDRAVRPRTEDTVDNYAVLPAARRRRGDVLPDGAAAHPPALDVGDPCAQPLRSCEGQLEQEDLVHVWLPVFASVDGIQYHRTEPLLGR